MGDILRRHLAPITPEAWQEIETTAKASLTTFLSGRAVVDVALPAGWGLAAVNLGSLRIPEKNEVDGVNWATRDSLPLIEVRIPFTVSQLDADNMTRGAQDMDLDALETAARRVANFEENAIYNGFAPGNMKGILEVSPHEPVRVEGGLDKLNEGVGEAIKRLHVEGINGPYALVLPTDQYHVLLETTTRGYPLVKMLHELLEGGIHWSTALTRGVLLSTRGGDYQLVLGQDLSIGYAIHDKDNIELYFTESFAFRILEPAAAAPLHF
ncbi:MAG: family 1 encapsulin nanocompartment shell protein [Candidatus Hydrogenedentales bacterium]